MTKFPPLVLGDQLAQDISKAVVEAIGKTFDLEVKAGRYQINSGATALEGDVSGVFGVVQDRLEGTLTICFKTETIRDMLPRLFGNDVVVTNDVAMDAVGELTNMIFGQVKTELNQRGHHIRFGIPSVIKGAGHFIGHMHDGRYMLIPFSIDKGEFQIHFAVHLDEG